MELEILDNKCRLGVVGPLLVYFGTLCCSPPNSPVVSVGIAVMVREWGSLERMSRVEGRSLDLRGKSGEEDAVVLVRRSVDLSRPLCSDSRSSSEKAIDFGILEAVAVETRATSEGRTALANNEEVAGSQEWIFSYQLLDKGMNERAIGNACD